MSRFFCLTVLFCAAAAREALGATVEIQPVADAFVTPGPNGSLVNRNLGGAGALAISGPTATRAGATPAHRGQAQTLIRFNLASTKTNFDTQFGAGGWILDGAALRLFTETTPAPNPVFNNNRAGNFHIDWLQNDSWVEGTGTPNLPSTSGIAWNGLPAILSASDQSVGVFRFNLGTGKQTYPLSLASSLATDIQGGGQVSLRLYAGADSSDMSYLFNSRKFPTAANHPFLSVTAIPAEIVVAANTSTNFPQLRAGQLTLAGPGSVAVVNPQGGADGLAVLNQLVDGPGTKLDLNDNDMILNYADGSPVDAVRARILAGLAKDEGGGQIVSSHGAGLVGEGEFPITLHVAVDNAGQGATEWLGRPLSAPFKQVIVKYTYFGDLNLDGAVNAADYLVVDGHFGTSTTGGPFAGDANLDGVVDAGDYVMIDNAFGRGAPTPLGGADFQGGVMPAAVPEPAGWVLGVVGAAAVAWLLQSSRQRRVRGRG